MGYGRREFISALMSRALLLRKGSVDEFGVPYIDSLKSAYVKGFPLTRAEQANQNVVAGLVEAMNGEGDNGRFLKTSVTPKSVEIVRRSISFILSHIFGNGPKIQIEITKSDGEFLPKGVDEQLNVFLKSLIRRMSIGEIRNLLESVIGNLFVFGASPRYRDINGEWVVPRFTNLVTEGNNQNVTFANFSMNLGLPELKFFFGDEVVKKEALVPPGSSLSSGGNVDFFFIDKAYEGLLRIGETWDHGRGFVHYNGVGDEEWKIQEVSSLEIDYVCPLSESPGAINLSAVDQNRNIMSVTAARLVPIATRLVVSGMSAEDVQNNIILETSQSGARFEVVDGNLGENASLWLSMLFNDSQGLAVQLGAPVPGEDVSSNEAVLARRTYFSNLILPSVVAGIGDDLLQKYVALELKSGGDEYALLRDLDVKSFFRLPRDEIADTLKAQKIASLIQLGAALGVPLTNFLEEYARSLNLNASGTIGDAIEQQRAAQEAQSVANQLGQQQAQQGQQAPQGQ